MSDQDRLLARVALRSIGVSVLVLALKLGAWALTGGAALFSDAAESLVNVATSTGAFFVIRYSAKPADRRHPYGHHKAEYFSAVLIGALILIAAFSILREAWQAALAPSLQAEQPLGLALNALAGVVNAYWCRTLLKTGKAHGSPALKADGRHLLTDVISSAAVLVGVGAAMATGQLWLDPLLAALVALTVLWSGWEVVRGSIGALMDEAVDDDTLRRLKATISAHGEGSLEAHDVKTRRAGRVTFVEFHLVVPADMTVGDAHAICDRLEDAVEEAIYGAKVTIHVEPEAKAKLEGVVVL